MEIFNLDNFDELNSKHNSQNEPGLVSDSPKTFFKTKQPVVKQNKLTYRAAVKDKSRINLYIDGKFRFSLTLQQFSDAGLKTGQILTEEQLDDLKSQSDFGKLYQRTLEYVLTRPHSEKEVRDYLKRKKMKRELDQKRYDEHEKKLKEDSEYREYVKNLRTKVKDKNEKLKQSRDKYFDDENLPDLGMDSFAKSNGRDTNSEYADNRYEYRGKAKTNLPTKPGAAISEKDINRVIEKLKDERAIDDVYFAKYFVENRNRIKGSSIKKLKLELKAKGISDQIIKEAFETDEYGDTLRDEKEEIMKVIAKKSRKYNLQDEKDKQKIIQYLLRQGFPYDLVLDSLYEMDSRN